MSVTVEQLMVEVRADVRQALAELKSLDRTTNTLGGSVARYAKRASIAFGATAIIGAIGQTINAAKTFDLTIRQVGVQADISGKQLDNMGKLANKMGADTIYSSQDAAQAMLELAKGGLTAAQIKGGALATSLQLAAAGGLDMATAANDVSKGMHTFGLSAAQATQVATALAGAANASSADVGDMAMALSQVGPGAKLAGFSIQETTAALAAFANAGIQGSDAGTSFKTFINSMVPTTKKAKTAMDQYNLSFTDAHGRFKSLTAVSQDLQNHLGKLSQAQQVSALKTIFGTDAFRAAAILMQQGAKGVKKLEKATNDQTKVQAMANVTMGGASGAWENFKGSAQSAAITLGQQVLPAFADASNAGAAFINKAVTWGPKVKTSFAWIGPAAKTAWSGIKLVADVAEVAVKAFDALPGPVKSTATEALLLALVMPKLFAATEAATAGIKTQMVSLAQWRAELTYTATRGKAVATAMGKMATAAKVAAGVGGILALQQSMKETNDGLSVLEGTAGAAALGFSMGGPWGAAIGGAVGGFQAWDNAVKRSAQKVQAAITLNKDYADSFDAVTGAVTKQTRQTMFGNLQNEGDIDVSRAIGIPDADMVRAALGNVESMARIQARVKALTGNAKQLAGPKSDLFFFNKSSASDFINGLKYAGKGLSEEQKQFMETLQASQGYKQALKSLPKKSQTEVKALGIAPAAKAVAELAAKYKLNPKQIKTVLTFTGSQHAKEDLAKVQKAMKDTANTKPNTKAYTEGMKVATKAAAGIASAGGKLIATLLGDGPKKARTNLNPFTADLKAKLNAPAAAATAGGTTIGSNMKAGVLIGFSGTANQLAAEAAAAVRQAIVASRRAANIKSPSRKMHEVGDLMGQGLVNGLRARQSDAGKAGHDAVSKAAKAAKAAAKKERQKMKDAGRSLIDSLASGVLAGGKDWDHAMNQLQHFAQKFLKGSDQDKFLAMVATQNRKLKRLYAVRLKDQQALATAQANLSAIQQTKADFVSAATGGMASQATVVGIGDDAGSIATSLKDRVAKVMQFAGLLTKLRGMGYSNAIITELASAGVDQGLAAAKALASADAATEASINSSYQTITDTATATANALGSSMYDAGIASAQGIVDGLKDKTNDVTKAIRKLAQEMIAALKAELKIKSPSRVMAKMGSFAGLGLARGLLDTVGDVSAASARLAHATVPGLTSGSTFGTRPPDYWGPATGGAPTSFTFVTHNPVAEPQSRTTNKALDRAAALGITGR